VLIFFESAFATRLVCVEPQHSRFTGTGLERVPGRALRAHPIRMHRLAPPAHRLLVQRILRKRRSVRCAENLPCVGLVLREPQLRRLRPAVRDRDLDAVTDRPRFSINRSRVKNRPPSSTPVPSRSNSPSSRDLRQFFSRSRASGNSARAKLIVSAIDDESKAVELAETVQKHFPNLKIFARAAGRVHAYGFPKRGITTFYRETLGNSLDLGVDVLCSLGFRAHQAHRAAQVFKQHGESAVRDLAQYWDDDARYLSEARRHIDAFDRMFANDAPGRRALNDRGVKPIPPGDSSRG
jgi:voltage-gated potassium channel Kch